MLLADAKLREAEYETRESGWQRIMRAHEEVPNCSSVAIVGVCGSGIRRVALVAYTGVRVHIRQKTAQLQEVLDTEFEKLGHERDEAQARATRASETLERVKDVHAVRL